ncbi:Hsp33 family molecular chaperone HslO [Thermocrinis sp.]|uniref:Hsp33 family molecular chaperone HslO n=1 Tax=Thermocrinis sp. TaxID=2024383 RepID=UPI002FDCD94B
MFFKELDERTKGELRDYFEDRDYAVIAVPKEEPVRVYVIKADRTVETTRRIHGLDPYSTIRLGEWLLSALILSSLVKHASPQKVLLKFTSKEEIIVAEADGMGRVRGFMSFASQDNEPENITVVKELRMGTPYTSIIPVVSRDIKENLLYYFEQSEQIKTGLDMAVLLNEDGSVKHAGAYMVQTMGGTSPKVEKLLQERIKSFPSYSSILSLGRRPEDVVEDILFDMEPRIVGLKEVEYYCPCNEEIAKASLSLLSREEMEEILSDGPAEVVCKFCGRIYRFDRGVLSL